MPIGEARPPVLRSVAMRKLLPLMLVLALLPACGGSGGDDDHAKDQARDAAAAAKRERKRIDALERKLRAARRQAGTTTSAPAPSTSTPTSSCPAGLVRQGTEACVMPGGKPAGCNQDQYSTPKVGGGCIGPAHPPSSGPAKPEDCPPGQVPAGETGACAPKD